MSDVDVVINILLICSYLGPISYILRDKYSEGRAKNYWLLSCVLFSVVAWLIYIVIMPEIYKKKRILLYQQKLKKQALRSEAPQENTPLVPSSANVKPPEPNDSLNSNEIIEAEIIAPSH